MATNVQTAPGPWISSWFLAGYAARRPHWEGTGTHTGNSRRPRSRSGRPRRAGARRDRAPAPRGICFTDQPLFRYGTWCAIVFSDRVMPQTGREFPILITERLRLRAARIDDAERYAALLSNPQVTRFSNLPDRPKQAAVDRLMHWMSKLHASRKGCAWIIEDAASNELIGAIRFSRFDHSSRVGEVGYELHHEYWGRGLMTEALRTVVAHGHRRLGLNRIEAWTLPGNAASDRVLEKAGFRFEGKLRQKARFKGAFHDFRMFGRLAEDPRC
jgi:[ribosomal protein S5]-alanine N-acetyltransferase